LSPTTPKEIIERIRALVVGPQGEGSATVAINTGMSMDVSAESLSSADVQLRLIPPDESKTSKEFSWLQLRVDVETIYYVVQIVAGVVTILNVLQPHIQDIRELDTDLIVPFEQLVERVIKTLDEEQHQPPPKNEHQQQSDTRPEDPPQGD
jgi:hypothetical protein